MRISTPLLLIAAFSYSATISPALTDMMISSDENAMHYVLIKPLGEIDGSYIDQVATGMTSRERRQLAVDVMKSRAELAQSGIMAEMLRLSPDDVQDIRQFWIVNAIVARLSNNAIKRIASRDDVLFLRPIIAESALIGPVDVRHEAGGSSRSVVWGVEWIGAPDVWAMGYDGSGVLVSIVDTGVDYDHLDLQGCMWHDSASGLDYGWDFENNDGDPMDSNGHGTHCAGTITGDGTAGTETGVAPGATLMALRVGITLDAEPQLWSAYEFSIEHDADVISTSMGWCQEWNPDRFTWRESQENLLAAGICHAVSAGSEGGDPYSWGDIRTPGDCPPPWLHPDQTASGDLSAVVTVGATDSSDVVASFSSVGYSTWMYDAPWYDYNDTPPNAGLIDPDITAPGVNILSCELGDPDGYIIMSGTSMATPHIAGCMALLLDANPDLTPSQIDSLLEMTAVDLGDPGKDNFYGSGRVNVLEAVEGALEMTGIEGRIPWIEPGLVLSRVGENPLGSILMFDLYTPTATGIDLEIHDISGRLVETVFSGPLQSGSSSFSWIIPDEVGSGVYFLSANSVMDMASLRFVILR